MYSVSYSHLFRYSSYGTDANVSSWCTSIPMPVVQTHTQGFAHCQLQQQLQAHTGTVTSALYPL
jgi:hypothetical protein